jgi:hypothetical protein
VYALVLAIHSLLRWALVGLLVAVPLRALRRAHSGDPFDARDNRLSLALVIATDLQLLLGLLLYVGLSPMTQTAFGNMAAAMKDRVLRYWTVEHASLMLIAVVLVHIARISSKRAKGDGDRHRRLGRLTLVALLVVLEAMPWPFLPQGRPLLPGL